MGCDIHAFKEKNIDGKWIFVEEIDIGRNYGLFAQMADVRNYHDNKFISLPKGLPKGVSESVKKEFEDWSCDAHSASFLSFSEIKSFAENNKVMCGGIMDFPTYKKFKETGNPYPYSQGVFGPNVVICDEKEIFELSEKDKTKEYHCHTSWIEESPVKYLLDFIENDNERLVFWFDN